MLVDNSILKARKAFHTQEAQGRIGGVHLGDSVCLSSSKHFTPLSTCVPMWTAQLWCKACLAILWVIGHFMAAFWPPKKMSPVSMGTHLACSTECVVHSKRAGEWGNSADLAGPQQAFRRWNSEFLAFYLWRYINVWDCTLSQWRMLFCWDILACRTTSCLTTSEQ